MEMAEKYRYFHSKEFYQEVGERRSGKTADLIVTVLERLQDGKPVTIVAHTARYAHHIITDIKAYARRLGLDDKLVRGESASRPFYWYSLRGRPDTVVYDHHVFEDEKCRRNIPSMPTPTAK